MYKRQFLYYVLGSADKVAAAMKALNKEGRYAVSEEELAYALGEITGGWASSCLLYTSGDMFAVVLAVGGVFLLATGGDPRTLSVPAECILSLIHI